MVTLATSIRQRIKAARKRGARWVSAVDIVRLFATSDGRSRVWTRFAHGGEVHQTSTDTAVDRYPELFDLIAKLKPQAERILSFGCSSGEELQSLSSRFPSAEIVGAEINARARRLARRLNRGNRCIRVVRPNGIEGSFDVIFALAVLQREPHKIAAMDVSDLTPFYPFARFDEGVSKLVRSLRPRGILCVDHAHYRVEDSAAAAELQSVPEAPQRGGQLFGPDGRRLRDAEAATMFIKN